MGDADSVSPPQLQAQAATSVEGAVAEGGCCGQREMNGNSKMIGAAARMEPRHEEDSMEMISQDDVSDEEGEEATRALKKMRRKHPAPSAGEREEHVRTHLPFRTWCEQCMAGRGVATGHKQRGREDVDDVVPTIGFDYCFLRNAPGEPSVSVIVSKDRATRSISAHAVPHKGAGVDWAVDQAIKDLKKIGYYSKVVLRSDQEPAVVDFLEEIARRREGCVTVVENAPVGESQSNGLAERGVRSMEEMMRVFKLDLEARVQHVIPMDWAVLEWMIEHVCDVLNKTVVGKDGRTAYERVKGKKAKAEFLRFADPIMARGVGKPQGGVMAARWFPALWLGQRYNTYEHLVARLADGKVVRVRSVQSQGRYPTVAELEAVVGRPWMPSGTVPIAPRVPVPPREVETRASVAVDEPSFVPRNFYITKDILEKYGYNKSCAKCRALSSGRSGAGVSHSAGCREFIEKKVQADEGFRDRLETSVERRTRYLAEEIERNVKMARREVRGPPAPVPDAPADASASSSQGQAAESAGRKRKAEEHEAASSEEKTEIHVPEAGDDDALMESVEQPSRPPAGLAGDAASSATPGPGAKRGLPSEDRMDEDEVEEPPAVRQKLDAAVLELHGVFMGETSDDIVYSEESFDPSHPDWIEELQAERCRQQWKPQEVQKAQMEEMQRFDQMGVYRPVTEEEARADPEGVVLGTRWVTTNKGTEEAPRLKSRLVCQEFRTNDKQGELFAGTPGLKVIKLLLSGVATGNLNKERILCVLDIKSAFLYAHAVRSVYIRLPDCAVRGDKTFGKLLKAMYGCRDAPQLWQACFSEAMKKIGFVESTLHPGLFYHSERKLEAGAHVDDVLATGSRADLRWMVSELMKRFELKFQLIGPGESLEGSYLGRCIRWTSTGVTWTHSDKFIKTLENFYHMEAANGVATPMTQEEFARAGEIEESEVLGREDARRYRAAAATINFLAQDRPDLCVASCALARSMSLPKKSDEVRVKRVIRYLRSFPVASLHFDFQPETEEVLLQTDSDWGSCRATRRSCSGGAVMIGAHLIHHWSKMQAQISLSSAESELYASNRGYIELASVLNVGRELRHPTWGCAEHQLDSNASRGIILRKGAGQLKHLEIRDLWCQGFVREKQVKVTKIPRAMNAADALASPCSPGDLERHMTRLSVHRLDRAFVAPHVVALK